MFLTSLSDQEKKCFCSLLLAAVTEDSSISDGEVDGLVRYRRELDVSVISDDLSYEEAASWLSAHSSELTKRSVLLELATLLYSDAIVTGEESDLLKDVARRFNIGNLKDYVDQGKKLSEAYASAYKLFDGLF